VFSGLANAVITPDLPDTPLSLDAMRGRALRSAPVVSCR
jgi:hypothetical protein